MTNIQDSYFELVDLIQTTEQQPQTDLNEVFVRFPYDIRDISGVILSQGYGGGI